MNFLFSFNLEFYLFFVVLFNDINVLLEGLDGATNNI